MCDCDYSVQAYWDKRATARKVHRCGECREDILPGETYERVRGIWDGVPGTEKTCARCLEIRDRVEAVIPERWCWCFGEMLENANDEVSDWPADDPDRIWVEARLDEINEKRQQKVTS